MKLTHQEIETMGPEAVAQALEAAEAERDALRARVAELEQTRGKP